MRIYSQHNKRWTLYKESILHSLQSVILEVENLSKAMVKRTFIMYVIAGSLMLVVWGIGLLIYIMAWWEYRKPKRLAHKLINADEILECKIVDRNVNIKGANSKNFALYIETVTLVKEDKNRYWLDIQSSKSKEAAEKIVLLLQPFLNRQLL